MSFFWGVKMITIQNYVQVKSLEEAYELNLDARNRVLGGMLWLKTGSSAINTAIDLSLLGLDTIEETKEAFIIGAMVSLRQLEKHSELNAYSHGFVAKAVQDIVGVQFRNMATVGGSIFGRFGFSDVLTAFLAMDTYVELYKGGIMPLEEFTKMKKERDILVRLIVRKTPGCFIYQAMRNTRTDFPVLTCAVSRLGEEFRAVIGARPALAQVLRDADGILAQGVNADSARAFAEHAAETIPTGSNSRGSAAYRTHLIRVLTERALLELGGTNNGN